MFEDELRRVGPAPLSPDRHAALRAELLAEVKVSATDPESVRPSARAGRSGRGKAIAAGAVVAAVTLSATAAAAVSAWVTPDAEEASAVMEKAAPDIEVHLPGWRPELRAEDVACTSTAAGVPDVYLYASQFPLAEPITDGHYSQACSDFLAGPDSQIPYDPASRPVVCAKPGRIIPTVFVVADGDCGRGQLAPLTDGDLSAINEARSFEVSLLAFPEECPTPEQAARWVRSRLKLDSMPLTLEDSPEAPFPTTTAVASPRERACYRGWMSWSDGAVTVESYQEPD